MKKLFLYFILLLMVFIPWFILFNQEIIQIWGYIVFSLSIILAIVWFLRFEKLYNIKTIFIIKYILYFLIWLNLLLSVYSLKQWVSDSSMYLGIAWCLFPFLLKIEIQERYTLLKNTLLNSYLINFISVVLSLVIAIIWFYIYSFWKVFSNWWDWLIIMWIVSFSIIIFILLMLISTITYFVNKIKKN